MPSPDATSLIKAFEQGRAEAQNSLGQAYEIGAGMVKSQEETEKLWKKAAEQGDAGVLQMLQSYCWCIAVFTFGVSFSRFVFGVFNIVQSVLPIFQICFAKLLTKN